MCSSVLMSSSLYNSDFKSSLNWHESVQQVQQGWNVLLSLFFLLGKFHSNVITTRIYHPRQQHCSVFLNRTEVFTLDLGPPRPSEMLEPLNHRSQWKKRKGERSRGDENQKTPRRVDPVGVRLKTFHGCWCSILMGFSNILAAHSILFLNYPREICSITIENHVFPVFQCIVAGK